MIRDALDWCWLQWQRGWHPVGDVSRHSNWAKRRSGSCSFVWPNRWGRMVVRKVGKRRVASAEVKQQARYGPDWGAPPSSACMLSAPHYSGLKRACLPAFQRTTEDGQAAGRHINQKKETDWKLQLFYSGQDKRQDFLCARSHTGWTTNKSQVFMSGRC